MGRVILAVAPGALPRPPEPSHQPPPNLTSVPDLPPDPEPAGQPKVKKRAPSQAELEGLYPSLRHLAGPPSQASQRAWVAVFSAHPDAMHALLADYIKQVYAKPGRIGQRPMPKEADVDFEGLLYGEENERPLPDVLAEVVNVSARMFCQISGISRSQYQRILAGQYEPTVHEMRMIAKAIKRPPTYFIEYRKAMAIAAFINLVDERPGVATTIYRNYLEVQM